jgi:hypothetical protein
VLGDLVWDKESLARVCASQPEQEQFLQDLPKVCRME